jgi:hypothetical protein
VGAAVAANLQALVAHRGQLAPGARPQPRRRRQRRPVGAVDEPRWHKQRRWQMQRLQAGPDDVVEICKGIVKREGHALAGGDNLSQGAHQWLDLPQLGLKGPHVEVNRPTHATADEVVAEDQAIAGERHGTHALGSLIARHIRRDGPAPHVAPWYRAA